jgi:hypothetical protein
MRGAGRRDPAMTTDQLQNFALILLVFVVVIGLLHWWRR